MTSPPPSATGAPVPRGVQGVLSDLGTPLSEVVFLVVDLETTGATPLTCSITEVGAVRVRGGEVLAELGTLVRPEQAIPPAIAALTGITDAMVAGAPPISAVLPSLLEMTRGAVVVAHNAPFDLGFLRAACARHDLAWPRVPVLDTLTLSRAVLGRTEVRNHKLGTLAAHFRASTTPTHRALDDARATVDVLHGLLARIGNLGVTSLEEVLTHTARVPEPVRRKRHLGDHLPSSPGVYLFRGPGEEVLYVGSSVDLRARVRSYFTASEKRSRMAEMVGIAVDVVHVPCGTALEARVRELRLIAQHDPRYNRRSRRPEKRPWLKLTAEPFPRLSVVREVRDDAAAGAVYLGPYAHQDAALDSAAALHGAFALRRCTPRLPRTPSPSAVACVLAEMGRCGAPCTGAQSAEEYALTVERVREAMARDPAPVVAAASERMGRLAEELRFEDAAEVRRRLLSFLSGASRAQRAEPLLAVPELVAARRAAGGGWELVCVRRGRLAGTTTSPRGADPMPYVAALRATAEQVDASATGRPAATSEETELVLAWLEAEGVRLVHLEGEWSCPVRGAERQHRATRAALAASSAAAAATQAAVAASRVLVARALDDGPPAGAPLDASAGVPGEARGDERRAPGGDGGGGGGVRRRSR